jgi:hypothetical protein
MKFARVNTIVLTRRIGRPVAAPDSRVGAAHDRLHAYEAQTDVDGV